MKKILILLMTLLLSGCVGMPKGITPVKGFELDRYLGQWYEANGKAKFVNGADEGRQHRF